jgi:hypothetical protein
LLSYARRIAYLTKLVGIKDGPTESLFVRMNDLQVPSLPHTTTTTTTTTTPRHSLSGPLRLLCLQKRLSLTEEFKLDTLAG